VGSSPHFALVAQLDRAPAFYWKNQSELEVVSSSLTEGIASLVQWIEQLPPKRQTSVQLRYEVLGESPCKDDRAR
jgi:hypothetical protein